MVRLATDKQGAAKGFLASFSVGTPPAPVRIPNPPAAVNPPTVSGMRASPQAAWKDGRVSQASHCWW